MTLHKKAVVADRQRIAGKGTAESAVLSASGNICGSGLLTHPQGGVTLGRARGEPDADLRNLGIAAVHAGEEVQSSLSGGRLVLSPTMSSDRPSKRQKLTPPASYGSSASTSAQPTTSDFYSRAAKWNLEQEYEQRPRKGKKEERENTRLPVKTADGSIERVPEVERSEEETDSFLGTNSDVDEDTLESQEPINKAPKVPVRQQILEAREELARLALLINEDPEEHAGSLKKLSQLADLTTNSTIKKLALATQAAVYRDIIPGYRIRLLKNEGSSVK